MSSNILKAVIEADTTDFNSAMSSLGVTSASAAAAVVAAFAAAVGAVVALEKSVISTASSYEDLRIKMQGLVGDATKGAAIFEKWKKIAAESSFDTQELIGAYATIFALGGEKLAETQTLNIAAAAKLVGANAQIAGAQIAGMFLKLKTAGPNGTGRSIADTLAGGEVAGLFGKNAESLVKLARSGASAEVVMKALNDALAEQGELALQLDKQSFSGKLKETLGTLDLSKNELGAPAMEQAKKGLDAINKAVQAQDFSKLSDALERFVELIVTIVSSSGFNEFLEYSIGLVSFLIDGITGLVAAIALLLETLEPVLWTLNEINKIWEKLIDLGLDLVMPGTEHAAPTRAEIDAARSKKAQRVIVENGDGENAYA